MPAAVAAAAVVMLWASAMLAVPTVFWWVIRRHFVREGDARALQDLDVFGWVIAAVWVGSLALVGLLSLAFTFAAT